jgi:hypothetical protein
MAYDPITEKIAMSQATAFRTFAIEPPYQVRSLRKLLEKQIADQSAQLAQGYAKDWGDYQKRVGIIKGMHEAMTMCEEMEKAERQ